MKFVGLYLGGDTKIVFPVHCPAVYIPVEEFIRAKEPVLDRVDKFMEQKWKRKFVSADARLSDQNAVD